MIEGIVQNIKTKFVENLDEGLLLAENYENDYTRYLAFLNKVVARYEEMKKHNGWDENKRYLNRYVEGRKRYDSINHLFKIPSVSYNEKEKLSISKKYLIPYLAAEVLNTPTEKSMYHIHSDKYGVIDSNFPERFNNFWNPKALMLKAILDNALYALKHEKITNSDKVIINVGYRSFDYEGKGSYHPKLYDIIEIKNNGKSHRFTKKGDCKGIKVTIADIFIITNKHFIKLSISAEGVLDGTKNIIARDIKKLNISLGNLLEIYFHGHYDPETIVLNDYSEAHNLLAHLTDLRDRR